MTKKLNKIQLDERRIYKKEYNQRPEVKDRIKTYNKRPEIRNRRLEYQKIYRQRPEVIKRRKIYEKEYNQRPEVKKRNREYMHKHYWEGPKIRNRSRYLMRKNRANNDFRSSQKQLAMDRAKAISILVKIHHKEFERILNEVRNDNTRKQIL